MARKRSELEQSGPPITPDEAEAQALAGPGGDPEAEVRPEEFSRGIAMPIWESPLPEEVVEELTQPLDPSRVRRRSGRGGSQFEYLAGHDVKRRANELFGFGNWGYQVLDHQQEAAVEVARDNGTQGWHVAYKAVVEVLVRGCLPFSDVGYGDGVEYGPAALATARELAMKEAVTDGMKRALTGWGDQFGLILYAKGDEKQRIDRERNRADSTMGEAHAHATTTVPRNFTEISAWAEPYGETLGWPAWMSEVSDYLFKKSSFADLSGAERTRLGQKAAGAIVALREAHDPGVFPPPTRQEVQIAWASVLDGHVLDGPVWRMGDSDTDSDVRPSYEEYMIELESAAEQAAEEEMSAEAEQATAQAEADAAQERAARAAAEVSGT